MKPMPPVGCRCRRWRASRGSAEARPCRVPSHTAVIDSQRLAQHVSEDDSERDRRAERVAEQVRVDLDARVREREQGHDHEARPGMEPVLKALVRRDRRGHAKLSRTRELRRGLLAERARELGHALESRAPGRVGARDQTDGKAGYHRVDARLEKRDPEAGAEDRDGRPTHRGWREAKRDQRGEERRRQGQRDQLDVLGVDGRDHEQGDQVVDHQQRKEAHPQPLGSRCDQGEYAERERRVGRHRGAPALRSRAAGVEGEVDQHGHRHATRGGERGQREALPLPKRSEVELPLGLQPDDQEEERHQALVDPLPQVERDPVPAELNRELRGPDRLV